MRLIDADALKLEIACVFGSNPKYLNWLNHAPTIDAVPVIRCKDCKHWEKSRINYNEYVCYWGGYIKQEDDYCSWAERKEE